MSKHVLAPALLIGALAMVASTANADPITVIGPFHFLDNRSSNDVGLGSGVFLQYGARFVSPGGLGTTGYAEQGPFRKHPGRSDLCSPLNTQLTRTFFRAPSSAHRGPAIRMRRASGH